MTTSAIACEVARSDHAHLKAKSRLAGREDLSAAVQQAAAGDARAWETIVQRFDTMIRSIARRHGLRETDRDEVSQRTWLAFFRHAADLEHHPALGGWLALTARRESLRQLASSRREVPTEQLPVEPLADTVHEQVELEERREALRRAIARAPQQERRLLELMLQQPALSYEQIGTILGVPVGGIGPTRGRCIARLRRDSRFAQAINERPVPAHELV